jgi:hypothetical protein
MEPGSLVVRSGDPWSEQALALLCEAALKAQPILAELE